MAGASFGTGFNALAGARPPVPGRAKSPAKPLGARLTTGPQATFTPAPTVKPQAPPAPIPPKASGTTTAPAQSPLDSTYYQQLASHQLRLQNQTNSLTATSQNDATALQSALAQLAYQQPRDELKAMQGANQRGALYSSAYTQGLGNLNNSYQTRQGGLVSGNAQRQAGIAAQLSALNQAEPITEAGLYDQAVARSAKNVAANPATGQAPIPPPIPAATLAARSAASRGQAGSRSALAKAIANATQRGRSSFVQTGARSR